MEMPTTGYIKGLAYTEVQGLDIDGNIVATLRTRIKGNNENWVTNKEARKELKDVYGATAFKRRNVWKFDPIPE